MPTGLDFIKMMLAGQMPPPTIADHVNMTLKDAAEGKVLLHATADGSHLNPMQGVHGGFAATVLDTACGYAVMSTLPEGKMFTSIDLALKFLRPIPRDALLLCEGTVQKSGKTVAFVEASLKTQDGKLLAHATSSCAIIPIPGA